MPIISDFSLSKMEDAILNVSIAPATAIGGWHIQFQVQQRHGGISGLITASCASGFGGGVSGITVTNSGEGRFRVAVNSPQTSGWNYQNFAYNITRLDSGSRTIITEGNLLLMP